MILAGLHKYNIAGNLSQISRFCGYLQKFSVGNMGGVASFGGTSSECFANFFFFAKVLLTTNSRNRRGRPGPFYPVNDISVHLGRQRGGGVPNWKNTFRRHILHFWTKSGTSQMFETNTWNRKYKIRLQVIYYEASVYIAHIVLLLGTPGMCC